MDANGNISGAAADHSLTQEQQIQADLQTLGIDDSNGLTQSQLKSAYRRSMLRAHPDKGGLPGAAQNVQGAYEALQGWFFGA
jgi:hypothetical protein